MIAHSRPEIALITNHGYAGLQMPVGGAPDTGGQIVYVNHMARALESIGYRVTIFTRGGFPEFGTGSLRLGEAALSDHVRYVFVPGGGDSFIRKEDIAVALDEQLEWLYQFVRREAEARGCPPHELYEFVSTHYWDAAVLGVGLIERWQNDIAANTLRDLLDGVVSREVLDQAMNDRHWNRVGKRPEVHLGRLLIEGDAAVPLRQRINHGVTQWTARWGGDTAHISREVDAALAHVVEETAPAFEPLVAARVLGRALTAGRPEIMMELHGEIERCNRHVWTPHSLGDLKDWNFRRRQAEVRRSLKFCERRSHERMICDRTPAVAATSVDLAQLMYTHYGVEADRIFYFPPCIDTASYHPYDEASLEPTYRYLSNISGVPVDELRRSRIVFETGRMDQTKRKDLLLSAFGRIAPEHQDAYLFVGGGPENDLFRSLRDQIQLNDSLRGRAWLTGPIPDEFMGPLFSLADVYATPSEMEGFGMTVSQAAAAGTLVISSDVIPFSLHHVPDVAVLFRAGDVKAMARALHRALSDEGERREKALAISAKVRQLDWFEKSKKLISFLRGLGMEIAEGADGA